MRSIYLIVGLILLAGCATAVKRDAKCLSRLTPGYLAAQQELTEGGSGRRSSVQITVLNPAFQTGTRHHVALEWYPKVYGRLATRLEEAQMLSETRWILAAYPPALIFYPIIRWNIHTVMWDGTDPDAGSDPINLFCASRFADDTPLMGPNQAQPE